MAAFNIDPETCEDAAIEDASVFGRNFAQAGGLTSSIENYVKEKGLEIEFKPVKASGFDEIKKTMVMAKGGRLQGNFIEGMMCEGGCIGGPALIGENTYNYKVADTEIYMHPCDKLNELEKIIPQLKQQGVTGVVAGTLASTVAMKYGMKVEMLDTKVPSIKGAIKEAVIS